jgi:hypothetical protein
MPCQMGRYDVKKKRLLAYVYEILIIISGGIDFFLDVLCADTCNLLKWLPKVAVLSANPTSHSGFV